MLTPNNNRGMTYQTDKKHITIFSRILCCGVVNIAFRQYLFMGGYPKFRVKMASGELSNFDTF